MIRPKTTKISEEGGGGGGAWEILTLKKKIVSGFRIFRPGRGEANFGMRKAFYKGKIAFWDGKPQNFRAAAGYKLFYAEEIALNAWISAWNQVPAGAQRIGRPKSRWGKDPGYSAGRNLAHAIAMSHSFFPWKCFLLFCSFHIQRPTHRTSYGLSPSWRWVSLSCFHFIQTVNTFKNGANN